MKRKFAKLFTTNVHPTFEELLNTSLYPVQEMFTIMHQGFPQGKKAYIDLGKVLKDGKGHCGNQPNEEATAHESLWDYTATLLKALQASKDIWAGPLFSEPEEANYDDEQPTTYDAEAAGIKQGGDDDDASHPYKEPTNAIGRAIARVEFAWNNPEKT